MLERIGLRFESLVRRFMPDPFLLALLLTFVTLILAKIFTPHSTTELIAFWFGNGKDEGFWSMLTLAMQMVLIVVTGEAVAASPLIQRAIRALAEIPKTPARAVAFVSFISMLLGWLHWGFGLVCASLLAREVAVQAKSRGVTIHYPLLGAAAYTAQLIWHGGLSASAPLMVNTPKHIFETETKLIPLSETIFTPTNFLICGLLLLTVPFIVAAMTPKSGAAEISAEALAQHTPPAFEIDRSTFAGKLDASPLTSWLIVLLGASFLCMHFEEKGPDLNLNVVNFIFLMLGLALYRSPVLYMKAITQSMRGTAGIVLQFPFYGGIMGVMKNSGLAHMIALYIIQSANERTLPFFAYIASVFAKLFIPSGAGEFAVEGRVMIDAAVKLNAPFGKTIMGVAYGNMVGNMFQPFWALPLLGIMGLKAREIMGYCLVIFCFALPLVGIVLLLGL